MSPEWRNIPDNWTGVLSILKINLIMNLEETTANGMFSKPLLDGLEPLF
jgi:hypothetical protein